MNVIYLPGFVTASESYKASDAVGYGHSTSDVFAKYLPKLGVNLTSYDDKTHNHDENVEVRRLRWIYRSYEWLIDEVRQKEYDAVMIFHAFQQFPSDVKRILADLELRTPLVAYSLGSHWDPTDTFRSLYYPDHSMSDLGNLLCADRVLVVSRYFRDVVVNNVSKLSKNIAKKLDAKIRVVGLPLNTELLDNHKADKGFEGTSIIFNHTLLPSKNPFSFLKICSNLLKKYNDLLIIFTRGPERNTDQGTLSLLQTLAKQYPDRVTVGNTMPLSEYYSTLWRSDIQVSTATHETLGISTLEAMYTHNCCILPNRCSYPEVTDGYEQVLYGDEDEMLDKLSYFIENESERKRVSAELARRSLRFSPMNICPKVADVLEEVSV
ncbi:MAG: glycosyltransferase [Nitrososphaerales archaeon]